jgi:hypothetical protein
VFYSVINNIYLFIFFVVYIMRESAFVRNLKGVRLTQINYYQIRQSQRSKPSQFSLASQIRGQKIFVTNWLFKFFWSQKKENCFFNNRTALRDAERKERYSFVRPLEAYK